jgi:hypothetical protein
MERARKYLKLAARSRELSGEARDTISRNQLATLEQTYLTLAQSSRVLRHSAKTLKALEQRYRK